MTELRQVRVHLPPPVSRSRSAVGSMARRLKAGLLTPAYWALAHRLGSPGLDFHRRSALLGLRMLLRRRSEVPRSLAFQCMIAPMDTVRYFEFDFAWRAITAAGRPASYLDVSSPRLFPVMLLCHYRGLAADLLNPDGKDLEVTRQLARGSAVADRCRFHDRLITDAPFPAASFDLITCLSVIEHIPEDASAVRAIWTLLKPGGRLLLSVPCAPRPFEELVTFDEYGLLAPDADGYVFGQRFYDSALLAERVFAVTGRPRTSAVYGEREPDTLAHSRTAKLSDPAYPFYREPYTVAQRFGRFPQIEALPATGVIAMEFVKE
jgi:SAM-dependent methyltransferase